MVGTVLAAGHRPQVPRDAIRGGIQLYEVLLEGELRDGGELSVELGGAARLEVRYDAKLACDEPPSAVGADVAEAGVCTWRSAVVTVKRDISLSTK
jgi:hypothetical protein